MLLVPPIPVRRVPVSLFPNVFGQGNDTRFAYRDNDRIAVVSSASKFIWAIPNRFIMSQSLSMPQLLDMEFAPEYWVYRTDSSPVRLVLSPLYVANGSWCVDRS